MLSALVDKILVLIKLRAPLDPRDKQARVRQQAVSCLSPCIREQGWQCHGRGHARGRG